MSVVGEYIYPACMVYKVFLYVKPSLVSGVVFVLFINILF